MINARNRRGWIVPALAEACLWLLPPALFLHVYVNKFNNPAQAILPHMCVVGALWLGSIGARALLPMPRSRRAYIAAAVVVIEN